MFCHITAVRLLLGAVVLLAVGYIIHKDDFPAVAELRKAQLAYQQEVSSVNRQLESIGQANKVPWEITNPLK